MDELEIINRIETLSDSGFIGDDCAYIADKGIVITQDSFVEGIHFKREWYTPYQLGYKAAAINTSDVLASGAKPAYLTVAVSLPQNAEDYFNINKFINGVKEGAYGAQIIGGDTTGSKNVIFISITAIGNTSGRKISSRKNAKPGYAVVVSGEHGASAAGLKELISGNIKIHAYTHLKPNLDIAFSELISENIKTDYAMMDTSDGLADALFKIALASNVQIRTKFELIPHRQDISENDVLFGGEDYRLVAAVPIEFAKKNNLTIIGTVHDLNNGIYLEIDDKKYQNYKELNVYNHFGD